MDLKNCKFTLETCYVLADWASTQHLGTSALALVCRNNPLLGHDYAALQCLERRGYRHHWNPPRQIQIFVTSLSRDSQQPSENWFLIRHLSCAELPMNWEGQAWLRKRFEEFNPTTGGQRWGNKAGMGNRICLKPDTMVGKQHNSLLPLFPVSKTTGFIWGHILPKTPCSAQMNPLVDFTALWLSTPSHLLIMLL